MLFYDFEVFKYDWLVVLVDPIKKKEWVIVNDRQELAKKYQEYKNDIWCGFNSRNYDQWILKGILCGFDPKSINDWIIVEDEKGYEYSSLLHKFPLINYDVMPNIPVSLKVLEGFMGENIHETSVPFDIDRKLTESELKETTDYCRSDVYRLIDVFLERKSEFDAQLSLIKTFNLPLKYIGKTQAQLAAIILGAHRKRFHDEWAIRLPETLQLGKYKVVGDWFLNPNNWDYDKKLIVDVCGLKHTLAWGGIHAGEVYHYMCKPDEIILDVDVDQLYPTLMIEYGLLSRAVENPDKFKGILDTSLRLKAEGKKKEREPFKRICNITYGSEGDRTNDMYDPLHRSLVCIFGQVLIIDLLDKVEDLIELIQSNTDGIFVKLKKKDVPEFKRRVELWEKRTHLHMSYSEFSGMHQKDVNNYIAVPVGSLYDDKGKPRWHSKGAYVKQLDVLDYDLPIVNEAVKMFFLKGTPVEQTILKCNELIKFQKIVKLSNKFEWVEHENLEPFRENTFYLNKAYRVFASKREFDGRLLKCKHVFKNVTGTPRVIAVDKRDKFANTPDKCFVWNGNIHEHEFEILEEVDREWYIDLAKKRINDFYGGKK